VSDEDNSLIRAPTFGSRRVSVRVGAPIIAGCALLGSIIGVTHPLRSTVSDAQRGVEPTELRRGSATGQLPETATPLRSEPAQSTGSGPAARSRLTTGTVERPLSPGPSQDGASTLRDRPDLAASEAATRSTGPSQRHARAKRLRRMLWRRGRAKPSPGAQVDGFISAILPKK